MLYRMLLSIGCEQQQPHSRKSLEQSIWKKGYSYLGTRRVFPKRQYCVKKDNKAAIKANL